MSSKVIIIILNWNGWKDTLECLESVYQIEYLNYDIIVVDNGSKDESIKKIKNYVAGKTQVESSFSKYDPYNKSIRLIEYSQEELKFNDKLKKDIDNFPRERKLILIKNNENYGFAEGNNIAIKYALEFLKPDYLLLLNNDTIVDPGFLDELVQTAESDPHIGVVGPTIYDYKPPHRLQSTGSKILWNRGDAINLTHEEYVEDGTPMEVDAVTGCALLAKSEVFRKIGGLNKNYFAYFEEIEWCVRARNVFYKIAYVPKGKIWHKGGATSSKITGFGVYHHTRNRFWFMKQHASHKQYAVFVTYFFGFKLFTFVAWALLHRNKLLLVSFLKGVKDGLLTSG